MPRQKSETESAALSFILTLSASLGTFGFFAVQGILLARILGPAGRGVFAACVVFPQALLYVGLLGASELFAGFAAEGMHRARLRRSAFLYGLTAGVVSLLLCVVLDIFSIPADVQHALPLAIFCAFTMPFQQIRLSVLAVDHGTRNLTRYNKSRLIAAAAFPALLLLSFSFGLFEQQPSWGHNSVESPQTEVGNLSSARSDLVLACWLFVLAHSSCLLLIQWGMTESWVGPSRSGYRCLEKGQRVDWSLAIDRAFRTTRHGSNSCFVRQRRADGILRHSGTNRCVDDHRS